MSFMFISSYSYVATHLLNLYAVIFKNIFWWSFTNILQFLPIHNLVSCCHRQLFTHFVMTTTLQFTKNAKYLWMWIYHYNSIGYLFNCIVYTVQYNELLYLSNELKNIYTYTIIYIIVNSINIIFSLVYKMEYRLILRVKKELIIVIVIAIFTYIDI